MRTDPITPEVDAAGKAAYPVPTHIEFDPRTWLERRSSSLFSPLAALSIAAAIFAVDTLTPFDIAIAVLYVVVVMMSLGFADRRGMILIATGCMALTVFSFVASHGFILSGGPAARCAISLAAIAITTMLALKVKTGIAVLGQREQRYRNIFLASGTAILELDFSGLAAALDGMGPGTLASMRAERPDFARAALGLMRLTNANGTSLKLFGADSVADLRAALPNLVPGETEEAVWSLLAAIREGRPAFEVETAMQTLDGKRIDVICTVAMPAMQPRLGQVLFSVMDVTARREAEDALRRAQTDLAHVSRVTTLGELTASIAHEVNQPLAAIVTNGQAGLRWANREPPDLGEVRSSLDRIVADARRASEVIQRLRALSSNNTPQSAPVNLNEIVEDTLALLQREIAAQQVTQRLALDPALPTVIGDRVQLQQVILNLAVNALQAMAGTDGADRVLVLRSGVRDGFAVIGVEDSGPGFPAGVPDKLFNPFYTTKSNGMGMGLSICRSIVEAHGGRIRAAGAAGTGAVFEIGFPVQAEAA